MTLPIKYYAWLSSIEDDVRVRDLTEDEIAGLVTATRPAPDKLVSSETLAAVVEALELVRSFGCPLCNGDCASANPPVMACPMAAIDTALQSLRGQP